MTFMSVTVNLQGLKRVLYVKYSIQFQAQQVETLVDFSSKVYTINPAFVAKFDLSIQPTSVGV